MARIVNLNRARKDRARSEKRRKGDANAALFGLTNADKALARAQADKATRDHAGHARDARPDTDAPHRHGDATRPVPAQPDTPRTTPIRSETTPPASGRADPIVGPGAPFGPRPDRPTDPDP